MVKEKEEERRSAQKAEEERRSVQKAEEEKAVGKLRKQASVGKGTPALGRGAGEGWGQRGGLGGEGSKRRGSGITLCLNWM